MTTSQKIVNLFTFLQIYDNLMAGWVSGIFWIIGLSGIKSEEDFGAYLVFTVYFSLLIFFGVAVAAVHGIIGKNVSQTLFTLIEDGSELVITAVIALSALGMWVREDVRG